MIKNLFLIILLLSLSLVTFWPSFQLGLYGDDWMSLYRSYNIPEHYFAYGDFAYLHYFFDNYGAQEFIMNTLHRLFGTQGFYYFFASFICRMFASLTLFPLVFLLTKNKSAAFFAAMFMAVTTIGIETSGWVFNMASYISLGCFNLFLFSYWKAFKGETKFLFPGLIFFIFSYSFSPIRMTGLVPMILLLELIWFFQDISIKRVKKAVFRLLVIGLGFVFISSMGASYYQQKFLERIISGANTTDGGVLQALRFVQKGDISFVFAPVTMVGSMLVPDNLVKENWDYSKLKFLGLLFGIWFSYLVITYLYFRMVKNFNHRFFKFNLYASFLPVLVTLVVFLNNKLIYKNLKFVFDLEVGGFFLLFVAFLVFLNRRNQAIFTSLTFGVSWTILGFFFAWWTLLVAPLFTTAHRYFISSALGISVLLALIIHLIDQRYTKRVLIVMVLFVFLHALATQNYFLKENLSRGEALSKRIWSTMPLQPQISDRSRREIYYIYGKDTNSAVLGNVVSFGGGYHLALINDLNLQNDLVPMVVDTYPLLTEQFKNGSIRSTDDVYAYMLVQNQKFIDITPQVRKKLTDEKF